MALLQITPRERKTLQLLANGTALSDIAASLGIDKRDLAAELGSLFARMGVRNGAEAGAEAIRRGLLAT